MTTIDRRRLLTGGAAALGGGVLLGAGLGTGASAAPALLRGRPELTHGVQSGEVSGDSAVIWTRADRESRMWVEISHRPDFKHARLVRGPRVTAETDFTGKVHVDGLRTGRTVHYRVWTSDGRRESASAEGRLRTSPTKHQDVRFVWSGDLAGQGWGINPELGGFRIFDAMSALDPDFFLCSGDFNYADGALTETVALPGGRTWRNIVIPEKTKVAETLTEYRGQYKYNLLDEKLRAFVATVPMLHQWDDHEVTNNWYPGEILDDARYTEKRVDVLAARARRAFAEYTPNRLESNGDGRIYRKISHGPLLDVFVLDMRTHKNANDANNDPQTASGVLGRTQLDWLKRELRRSSATWKVLAADLPLGLIVPDGTAQEGLAQGDGGAPLGREREVAELLSYVNRADITGTVWLTADVHYTAAHHYDPSRAAFKDFKPFWEFVSGPMNAGAFGPNVLDGTFGPEARFVKAPPAANTSPADGFQFFGEVAISSATKALTVRLRDLDGAVLFEVELPAE